MTDDRVSTTAASPVSLASTLTFAAPDPAVKLYTFDVPDLDLTLPVPPERVKVAAVIQCAMDKEAAPFLDRLTVFDDAPSLTLGHPERHLQSFVPGLLDGRPVLVVTSGVGLVNAASAATVALSLVDPEAYIVAGTVGGLHVDIEVGDITAGTSAAYNDADATAFGYTMGQIPQMPVDYTVTQRALDALSQLPARTNHRVMAGRIVSGDSFINDELVTPIRETFPDAIGTDMETAAIAQVCWSRAVDWVCLRAVSDLCGPVAGQDFHMDSDEAARISSEAVRAFLPLCCGDEV